MKGQKFPRALSVTMPGSKIASRINSSFLSACRPLDRHGCASGSAPSSPCLAQHRSPSGPRDWLSSLPWYLLSTWCHSCHSGLVRRTRTSRTHYYARYSIRWSCYPHWTREPGNFYHVYRKFQCWDDTHRDWGLQRMGEE